MAVIRWKWSEMSLIKVKALLSISTLVFMRSNLAFHAYVFFILQILMTFGQIWCPTHFWSITYSDLPRKFIFCCRQTLWHCSQSVQKIHHSLSVSGQESCSTIWCTLSLLNLLWKTRRLEFFSLVFF